MRPTGPGCRDSQTQTGRGGGEVPRSSGPTPISGSSALGRSGISPRSCWARSHLQAWDRGAPRRAGWEEPTARHRAGSFEARKASPAKPAKSRTWGQAARTAQLPAPRMGVVDDRTTEARARRAQQSGAGRELTPRGCGRLNWPHLHPSMPIADRHDRGHRISPRAAIGSPPGGDLNRGFDLGHREQKWGMP